MSRRIGWFSAGAASAIACRLAEPDVIAYCETGSEHEDNARFMGDCEDAFGWNVIRLKSEKYANTWEVWEDRRFLSGIAGAPCTGELKVQPRLKFQRPDDIHIFGYTADGSDIRRVRNLKAAWPDMKCEFPLIEKGLNKAACRALLQTLGIAEPVTYAMGFPNANCIGCVKSQSPAYWSLVRHYFPDVFWRMAKLSRELGVRLVKLGGVRVFIDEIPDNYPMTQVTVPTCDLLCQMAVDL